MNGQTEEGAGAPKIDPVARAEDSNASLGVRLRHRRESMGLGIPEIAARLKLRTAIIEAIENDSFDALGAGVFARGYLSAYAKAVGLPMVAVEYASSRVTAPALVTRVKPRYGTVLGRYTSRLGHVFLTAAIVVPFIWMATSNQLPSQRATLTSLNVPEPSDPGAAISRQTPSMVATPARQGPVMASLTPMFQSSEPDLIEPSPVPTPAAADVASASAEGLELSFNEDSWVQVLGADGAALESALVRRGSTRNYPVDSGLRIKLGNAQGVRLLLNGEPIDVSGFQRENVAHFRLGPDGVLARPNPG